MPEAYWITNQTVYKFRQKGKERATDACVLWKVRICKKKVH